MHPTSLSFFFQNTGLISLQMAEAITQRFKFREIKKDEFFLKEGRVSREYLFLEKGFMRAFAHDTEGDEVTTQYYQPGQLVFEVSSFFNHTPSGENIEALTDCEGWYIPYEELNDLFHGLPQFREFGRHILVMAITGLKSRMLSMITQTAEQRYEHLLLTNPEIFQYASLKSIATYLGVTDSSLSRIRRELSKK